MQGAGADIYGTIDAFHFASQTLTGDGEIIVRVATQQGTNGWAKAGLMLRDGLAANAANAFVAVTPSNGVTFQYRASAGASTSTRTLLGAKAPYWLKLVREGDEVRAYASLAGGQWVLLSRATVTWGTTLYAGLAVTSHNAATLSTVTCDGLALADTITDEQRHGLNLGGARRFPDTAYDEATGTCTLRAGGKDFSGNSDSGYLLYQPASGDLEVVARVLSVGNTDSWAKCGVTIRGGTGADCPRNFFEKDA